MNDRVEIIGASWELAVSLCRECSGWFCGSVVHFRNRH